MSNMNLDAMICGKNRKVDRSFETSQVEQKEMHGTRFELAPPKRMPPEDTALDRSATHAFDVVDNSNKRQGKEKRREICAHM